MPATERTGCPSHEQLVAFGLGSVTEQALETIAGHLESCTSCASALSTVRDGGDSLLSGLRRPTSAEQFLDEPEYRQAVERVRGIGYAPAPSDRRDAETLRPIPRELGRYEILEELGCGGMGTVYLARDTLLDREVALKIPHFRRSDEPRRLERFYREARAAATLEHPNLCPVYDVGEIDEIPYLSMARIRGKSLSKLLKQRERFSQRQAAEIVRKVALAVEKAHAGGIVHRDIKPSNIMLTDQGEPILTDFGLAQRLELEDPRLTRSGVIVGTPSYMAPEQVEGDPESLGPACDIYSLGVVLYELLSGRVPFEGPLLSVLKQLGKDQPALPSAHQPDVDRRLEAICLKALAKDPAKRFQTPAEMAEALEDYRRSSARAAGMFSRHRWLVGSTVFLASAALLFATATTFYLRTGEGSVTIDVNVADATVTIDGVHIEFKSPCDTISVRVGGHRVEVSKEGFQTEARSVAVRRGDEIELKITLRPIGPRAIMRRISTTGGAGGIQVSRDGSKLYVASALHNRGSPVEVFDVSSGKLLASTTFGERPGHIHGGVAVSPDERFLFTTNYYFAYVSRIDLKSNNIRQDLRLGRASEERWAHAIGITPDGTKLAVTLGQDGRTNDLDNDYLCVVDVADEGFSLLARVKLRDEVPIYQVGMSADSRFAYVVTKPRKSEWATLCEVSLTAPYEVRRKLSFSGGRLAGIAVGARLNRVFVSDRGHRCVAVVDLETFKKVDTISLDGYAPATLAINEANTLLAIRSTAKRIFCVDPADGMILASLGGSWGHPCNLAFSSDGRRLFAACDEPEHGVAVISLQHLLPEHLIVFASDRAGESYQVYVMGVQGRNLKRLTSNHATERCPRFSPDARRIAFISDRQGPPRICIMDRNGRNTSILENTDPVITELDSGVPLDWSPDGTQIAFVGDRGTVIRAVDVKTGQVRTLLEGKLERGYADHQGLSWRKTDGAILFNSQHPASAYTQDVFQLEPATAQVTRLTDSRREPAYYRAPVASPDGKTIAVVRVPEGDPPPSEIVLVAPDGTPQGSLTGLKDKIYLPPRWSPDGKEVVYAAGDRQGFRIFATSFVTRETTSLISERGNHVDPDVCRAIPALERAER